MSGFTLWRKTGVGGDWKPVNSGMTVHAALHNARIQNAEAKAEGSGRQYRVSPDATPPR